MNNDSHLLKWTNLTTSCGVTAFLVYPVLILVDLPFVLQTILAAAFGPLLGVATFGLSRILRTGRSSAALDLAPIFMFLAVAILTQMLLVQMAVHHIMPRLSTVNDPGMSTLWRAIDRVQLGLDVAWDVYGGIATFLLGWVMLRHPLFGSFYGLSGMTIALLLLTFNLLTFPIPPGNAGLIDLGPVTGLWYLVVMVRVFFVKKHLINEQPNPEKVFYAAS